MPTAAPKGMTETGLWPQLRDYWLPAAFSKEVGEELHIKGPDAVALAYRRFLGELGVE
ncbi:MAG: hypothetical protein QGG90_03500 [Nitrospinota bacterium]|jgi:hypothetical protein|nr:hypothetical protein [Nitrospinota bacterium]MDP6618482.1 hypothetical protein [Nitrospinota bacterium]MDP7386902.1 hypothetical protein [Nitrospinota bacterium]